MVWKGRAGQHTGETRAVRRRGFCFPAPPRDLRQLAQPLPPLPLFGCTAMGQLSAVWAATKHARGRYEPGDHEITYSNILWGPGHYI